MSYQEEISIKKSNLILLILDFLKEEGYDKSLVSLEMETSICLFDYPKEIIFLRNLILEGHWKSAEEFLSPLEEVLSTDKYKECLFEIRRQIFLEMIESDKSQVDDLVKLLSDLHSLEVKGEEFNRLVNCLSSDNIIDNPELTTWSILGGRLKCFEEIRTNLKKAFPMTNHERKIPNNSFLNLFKSLSSNDILNGDLIAKTNLNIVNSNKKEKKDKEVYLINDLINTKETNDLGERLLRNEKLSQSLRINNINEMLSNTKDISNSKLFNNTAYNQGKEGNETVNKNKMSMINNDDDKFDFMLDEEINFNERIDDDENEAEEHEDVENIQTKKFTNDANDDENFINKFIEDNELDKLKSNDLDDLDKEEFYTRTAYEGFNYNVNNFFAKVRIKDNKPIRACVFSPLKGDYLAIGTNSCSLKIFDIRAITYSYNKMNTYKYSNTQDDIYKDLINKEIQQVKEYEKHHNGSIYSIDWSCSGRLIASGSNDLMVKCLVVPSLESGESNENEEDVKLELIMEGHKGIVRCVTFDPNEELILLSCGQKENIIRVWDPEEGKVKATLEGHSSDINIIKWSNDNQLCASSGEDRSIRFWDLKLNKFVTMISCLKYDIINDISIYTKNKTVSKLK